MILAKKICLVISILIGLNLQGCTAIQKFAAENPNIAGTAVGAVAGAATGAAASAVAGKNPLVGAGIGALSGAAGGLAASYLCQASQTFLINYQSEELQGYKSLKKRIGYSSKKGDVMQVSQLKVIPTKEAASEGSSDKKVDISAEYFVMTPQENAKLALKEVWIIETQDTGGQYKRDSEEGIVKPVIMKPGMRKSSTSFAMSPGKHKLTLELHYKNGIQKSIPQEFVV
jgi:hypothetical protein